MLDQRRFAAARMADDPEEFAAINIKRHILHRTAAKGRARAVGVRQIFYTNDLGHSGSFPAGYSPGVVPFRHTWDVSERKASPIGESSQRLAR